MRLPKLLTTVLLIMVIHSQAWSGEIENGLKELASQHYSEALNIFLPLANAGNPEAQRLIGEMSFNGQGMKKNSLAAFKWNELSANSGNVTAQFNLGYLYEHGEGVPKSNSMALEWYTKAALQDYVPAERKLGDLYTESDPTKALYWYNKARQMGDQQALQKFSQLSTQHQKEISDLEWEQTKKRRIEESEADAKWQQEQQALRQKWAQEAEDNYHPVPNVSPFQGIDSINKIITDGQRTIAIAQAEHAKQQQWQQEADASHRDRQQSTPQKVLQIESNKNQMDYQRVTQADLNKSLPVENTKVVSTSKPMQTTENTIPKNPKRVLSKNTGKSAMQCVSVNQVKDDVQFTNTCDKQIFIVWCGDLKYTKQKCGDGPKGNSYYTHSNNIMPGQTISTSVTGQYKYAACEGGIAFGKDEIQDRPDGGFTCIAQYMLD